jgi:predicted phage tail protein
MISITLEGYLGKKLGKSWNLNVRSVVEIFEAIEANTNKITRFHRDLQKFVTHFVVYINGKLMPAHLLNSKILNSGDVLRVVPVIQGGFIWLIIGIVLIVLSMVLAVVLSPKAPKDVKTNSTILGGIRNVTNRNIPVPIGYGRLRIGSAVISNDILISNIPSNSTLQSSSSAFINGGEIGGKGTGTVKPEIEN